MSQHKNGDNIQIALLRKQLDDAGVSDINEIADRIQMAKEFQCERNIFSHDRFLEKGSNIVSNVHNGFNNEYKECIIWTLNHYLNLNRNPNVIKAANETLAEFGTGCGTSALSAGKASIHKRLEKRLQLMFEKEEVLLFPTGFTANCGLITGLSASDSLFLLDSEIHGSIIYGCRASGQKYIFFKHNDMENLQKRLTLLAKKFKNIYVIIESAYSMSGDFAPIKEIIELKKKFNFFLVVDEAHTFGLYGDKGAGYCSELGILDDVDFITGTLSKATASIGGYVATKAKFCTLLTYSSYPYIFQACTPPSDIAVVLSCLDEIERTPDLIVQLHQNNRYLRERLTESGFNLGNSKSPIVPIYISNPESLLEIAQELFENGIFTTPIVYPAVKENEGRLRLIVNVAHNKEIVDKTVDKLVRSVMRLCPELLNQTVS